jgi:DNA-binding NarL/FixJ family response regulator
MLFGLDIETFRDIPGSNGLGGDHLATSSIRVLVVEDMEPFRRFIVSTLQTRPELQVVGEVSNGLDAVQKALELHPDLILLDIGLPKLNGIEAAQRIRRLSSQSKILFVSQESSADIVQQVLSLGACGYVVKMDAGRELLAAVDAVLRGEQFVGSRFAGQDFSGASDIAASDEGASEDVRSKAAASLLRDEGVTHRHEAGFYSDDGSFLHGFTQFIGAALMVGKAVIVVATESHRDSLTLRLQADGLDIGAAIEEGRYISLDAVDTLSTFMVNGLPDPVRFLKSAGDLIMRAAKAVNREHARVVACGTCAPLLWEQGNADGAIQLERLWDQIARSHGVHVLCGYSLATFQGGVGSHVFEKICAAHSVVHSR